MLDEQSPIALYHQLKNIFMDKIERKEWLPDTKIPTERELCELYNVSRMTVRLALNELQAEGCLYRKQGKGTFIKTPKIEQRLQSFYSFSEEIRKMGMTPSTSILRFETAESTENIAEALGIKPQDEVYVIKRLRLADHEPFALETSYIPVTLCPGLNIQHIESVGLYKTLESQFGIIVNEAEEVFEAVIIDTESSRYLKTGKHSPGLLLHRTAGTSGRIVEFCVSLIRGDRYKYRAVLK